MSFIKSDYVKFDWFHDSFIENVELFHTDDIQIIYISKDIDFPNDEMYPAYYITIKEKNIYGNYAYKYAINISKNESVFIYLDDYNNHQVVSIKEKLNFSDFVSGNNPGIDVDDFNQVENIYETNFLSLDLHPDKTKLINKIKNTFKLLAFH